MKYVVFAVVVVLAAVRLRQQLRKRPRVPGSPEGPDRVRTGHMGAVLDQVGGDVGLVARREVRERRAGPHLPGGYGDHPAGGGGGGDHSGAAQGKSEP